MNDQVKKIVDSIKNPNTQKTLSEEGRIKQLEATEDKLVVTYNREGISPDQKRSIENVLVNEVKSFYSEEKVFVKTVSENSKDVFSGNQGVKKEQNAQVKAGHGPQMAQKKRVPGVKKVIAISSGKGGVGKSTVTVNLAYALKNLGKKVAILDADVYGPSIPMLMGKREDKPKATDSKRIIPIDNNGVGFISFGLFIGESDAVIWRGPMLGGILNQFLFDVEWGELDYLLIDLPPGTGDMQLSMVQTTEVDGSVVVSTPQDVALLDAKKGIAMFDKVKVPIIGLVENMSYFAPDDLPEKKYYIFGEGGVESAAKELGQNFLGAVPMEIALRESCDSGNPYMDNNSFEGRPVWNSYMELATNTDKILSKKQGFLSKLLKRK